MSSFEAIHAELASDDPLVAASLVAPESVVGNGPTEALHSNTSANLRIGVEAIREGHLLHWGEGRLVKASDEDFALLAGDRLYALGLESIAATGSTEAIVELSRLIKASATAMAAASEAASDDAWAASCARISHLEK